MGNIFDAILSSPEFKTQEEKDAYLEKYYDDMVAKRTTHDPKVVAKFYECLERAKTPKKWESLIRYPYIKGKPSHLHKEKTLPDSWESGHELVHHEDGTVMWHSLFVAPCPFFGHELYCHHSVQLFPDGKLIGETYSSGTEKLDLQDVHQILDKWLGSICLSEEQYWDQIDDKNMKKWK